MKKQFDSSFQAQKEQAFESEDSFLKEKDYLEMHKRLEELNRFKHLIDNVNDGIIVVEIPSCQIVDANHTAYTMLDFSDKSIVIRNMEEVAQRCESSERLIELVKNHQRSKHKIISTNIKKNDGKLLPIEISIKSASYRNQNYSIVIIRDVEEKINTEHRLILAKEEAEKSNYLKTEFLAQMSHEIRTPLNSILNFIALMKEELEGKVSDELKSCFKIIDNGSKRIIRTVDLLLDMSQIQTGNYEVHYKKINLEKDILENLLLDFYLNIKGKNLNLKFNTTTKDDYIYGDFYSVSQIFYNLIDNAIKYTTEGQIDVNLDSKDGRIYVEIKDTGIGISNDYLTYLFTPFTQEEMGYTRKFEGTGLGLALVKNYIELNNAEIKVSSTKGKGSSFTVIFDKYQD